ncbi:phospholipase A2 isozymes PA3A/PA3B/PA5-like [Glandiceps talaboti]
MNTIAAFLLLLSFICLVFVVTGSSIMKDPSITSSQEEILRRQRRDMANYIYPGTKWCGKGDVAENNDDLGEYAGTDTCCRTHDHCTKYIEAFKTDFFAFNPLPYTVSDCACDLEFYSCLKEVDTMVSRDLGKLYFNELQVPCLDFDVEDVCLEKGWFGWACTRRGDGVKAKFDKSYNGKY